MREFKIGEHCYYFDGLFVKKAEVIEWQSGSYYLSLEDEDGLQPASWISMYKCGEEGTEELEYAIQDTIDVLNQQKELLK